MKLPSLLILLLASLSAQAADAVQPLAALRDTAVATVLAQAAPSARAEALALDDRLRLPACAEALRSAPEPIRGGQVRVAVSCGAPAAWTVYVGVRLTDIRPVLTLARGAQRGEAIGTGLLLAQERDIASLPYGYFSDPAQLAGRQLRRPATAGSVLTPDMVEAQKLVRRGDMVTVVGRAGAMEVRSQGKALRDGAEGDRIPVENSSSRRVVEGQVTIGGVVEVRL
ncbi:flagellar basal body P-ring formation chaperone FlgA [Solimonas sp. SE-A11]|uniref:flagellar basal body P-ring formation chaperone FlgA n=1 Tax=Solimonas sp. SE-A11 TaxID=3054954 RepID=UPI00259C76FF|nr:flagellar basal body P-ring formation chaperone FlgA [Solimonas sp. SE-A11]MDM4771884.1 flagellar basal body P-ring formation chaperone FlgA [Solimonas sp. SE-A11]